MASLTITPELLTRAFQISDYITSASLSYPSEEAEDIVTNLVDERFRPALLRNPTSRTTQRSQSVDPPAYPPEWVVDRSRFVKDVKRFVKDYIKNKQATKGTRLGTVTPPRKDYSTGATPVRTPTAPSRRQAERDTFYDPVDPLILPSIEKAFATLGGEPSNTTTEASGSGEASNKPTSTPPSTMPDDTTNHQGTGFTEQQWNALQTLIGTLRANPAPTPPAPPAPETHHSNRWNAADIGFFDPHYDGKTAATAPAIEHAGKDTYFRDVHVFIERVKDMATIKGGESVRTNLYSCLRGIALEWYTSTLTEEQKFYVKHGENIDHWAKILLKRWKESPSTALATVTRERYTMDDARRRREPNEYAQTIIRAARSAEMSSYNQIYLIYNGLDLEFRRDLHTPSGATDMHSFLNEIEEKKEIWWALGARNRGSAYAQAGNQRPAGGFNNRPVNNPRPYGQGQYYQEGYRGSGNGSGSGTSYGYSAPPPLRNQFPTSYQYRASQYPSYQINRTYSAPQQQPRPPYGGQSPYPNRPQGQANQVPAQGFQQNRPLQQSGNPARPQQGGLPQASSLNPNVSGGQRQPFRPFNNYNNQSQWRSPTAGTTAAGSYPQQPQSQRAYHGETDENHDPTYEEAFGNDYSEQDGPYTEEYEEPSYGYYGSNKDLEEEVKPSANDLNQELGGFFVQVPSTARDAVCKRCDEQFPSRNKLHVHLRHCKVTSKPKEPLQATAYHGDPEVITSDASPEQSEGLGFRSWRYATIKGSVAAIQEDGRVEPIESIEDDEITPDSGCTMSVIDRQFLAKQAPNAIIKRTAQAIKVRGIGDAMVSSSEYTMLEITVRGTLEGRAVLGKLRRQIHVVDELKANMLLGSDILGPEKMVVDYHHEVLILHCCRGMTVTMTVTPAKQRVNRVVRASTKIVVPAHSSTMVPVRLRGDNNELPKGRDYMFLPYQQTSSRFGVEGGVLSHITDANMCAVQVNNTLDTSVTIGKNSRLGTVHDYEEEGCYAMAAENSHLAAGSNWFQKALKTSVGMLAVLGAAKGFNEPTGTSTTAIDKSSSSAEGYYLPSPTLAQPEPFRRHPEAFGKHSDADASEYTTPEGITIYGTADVQKQFAQVAQTYPSLWQDTGRTVDVPEAEWMPITLKPDATVDPAKVYPLGPVDREFLDQEFDKLHAQGRMEYTTQPTPFGWPVFVVWRTIEQSGKDPVRKGRVVVDIRGLNKITLTDTYPLPLQSDIISQVAGCQYITVVDAAGFFHQWLVRIDDRNKLTVVSHRGQEQFNVAAMGFKNSPPYVQRQIDNLLRPHRHYARAYVDDIVIFSKTLEEHLAHLRAIFELLDAKGVTLSAKKSFIGYPTVTLLGQRVDAFGLSAATEKIDAIKRLAFPYTLTDLELYLGLTGYLRTYIPYYAQKADALQRRKVLLLRSSPSNKGRQRKIYSQRTVLENPTDEELNSYRLLQEAFSKASFLVHFDRDRVLYIDIDASKQRGFGAMVYHLKAGADPEKPRATDIEPILFLSRLLNTAESKYWPTELEMAGLVWVVKRVRHMIEAATKTVVFTDHAANPAIINQTKLTSSSSDKLNLRLVRSSTYLSQFQLDIKYRPGKQHVIPDALSRLPAAEGFGNPKPDDPGALDLDTFHSHPNPLTTIDLASYHGGIQDPESDTVYAYQSTTIAMSPEFREKLLASYQKEPIWERLKTMVNGLGNRVEDEQTDQPSRKSHTGIDFKVLDGLIYHTANGKDRLCIPEAQEEEVFRMAHDENYHAGAHRCYQRISDAFYIPRLSRKLRTYIDHCPSCQVNQTKRHQPYGELVPISTPPHPFHTIAMDFIVGLPGKYDCLLVLTDKFTRRIQLIPGYITDSAAVWARRVLNRLQTADWGIPCAIICDRDPKFMSEFWREMLRQLATSLLASTAYHPQTDGLSERSNQTVEIAIRYLVTSYPDLPWWQALPSLQAQLNNSPNAATGLSPNEVVYGFKTKETLSLLHNGQPTVENISNKRLEFRLEAADATSFANAKAKLYYDARHVPLKLKAGDHAYLRLNHGYQLPGRPNKKVSPQRCGPFLVKRRIGRLAYELQLPSNWRVHPVVSVAQLEPSPTQEDPYNRARPDHPDAVEVEGDTPQWRSYVVERIVDKRMRTYGGTKVAQYLIRWRGYGPEYDEWRSITKLGNCMDLVEEYEARQREASTTPRQRASRKASASIDDAIPPQHGPSSTLRQPLVVIPSKPPATASTSATSTDPPLRRSQRQRLERG